MRVYFVHQPQKRAMFNKEYIARMAPAVFADNSAKGFHDSYRSPTIIRGLIASEIIEGFEALRNRKLAPAHTVQIAKRFLSHNDMSQELAKDQYVCIYAGLHTFEGCGIKDTVEAKMAGTCIRCFDAIGMRLHEGGGQIEDVGIGRADGLTLEVLADFAADRIALCLVGARRYYDAANIALFPEILLTALLPAMGVQNAQTDYLQHGVMPMITELNSFVETLANMARIATYYGVDLLTHIDLELAYNRTREYQHGGKTC